MNERIKELAEQCGADTVRLPHGYQYILAGEDTIQKFAELVIAQCMYISEKVELEYLANRREASDFDVKNVYAEGEAACSLVREKIAEHFGLE